MISDGEFTNNWDPWVFYVYDNQSIDYTPSIVDGVFVVDVTKSTGTDWHVGFQETGLSMKETAYELTFDAWSDQPEQLLISVARNYGDWGSYLDESAKITTERKSHKITLDMPVNDENVRLYFGIGRFTGKFYVDNIRLTPVHDSLTRLMIRWSDDSAL